MSVFDIVRWDPIVVADNTFPYPTLYVKPTQKMKDNIEKGVLVTIQNSESIYDGKKIPGVIKSSKTFPNFRPNFYADKDLYCLVLLCQWSTYPPKLGKVFVLYEDDVDFSVPGMDPFSVPKPVLDITVEGFGEKMHEEKCINLSKKQIWLLIGGFVVVLLLVGLLSSSTEKEKGITKSHRKRRKRRNV